MGDKKAGGRAAKKQAREISRGIGTLRREGERTQENLAPFIQAGQEALAGQQEGTTVEGLDAILRRIFSSETFGAVQEQAQLGIEGQLASAGLMRSGTAIRESAQLRPNIALQIENLLFGRQEGLAAGGRQAALGGGQIGANIGANIAKLFGAKGEALAAGTLTDAQTLAGNIGQVAQLASGIFFSDPSLKENVEKIAEIHDLNLYQWDWKDITKGTVIEKCHTMGFLSDEVREKYPQHVYRYGIWDIVDYFSLLDDLEMKIAA